MSAIITFIVSLLGALFGGPQLHAVSPPLPVQGHAATVIFGGDMMFDRSIRATMDAKGGDYLFSCIDDVLLGADVVLANLEGPITASTSVSVGSKPGDSNNFTFTFPTSTAALLHRHGIRIVNLGNNHIMNFGRAGLLQTKRYLSDAQVQYFGDPDAGESDRVLRTEIRGVPFSFVNWSDWTSDKTDHTIAQVRLESENGRVVVVYAHWGEEYVPPLPRVRALAHQFVDAGAAIVVGSHPHIVQEHEVYRGKDIFYSLGNFVFDQYWERAVREGLLLKVTFDSKGATAVEEIPVELLRDRRTCPLQST